MIINHQDKCLKFSKYSIKVYFLPFLFPGVLNLELNRRDLGRDHG